MSQTATKVKESLEGIMFVSKGDENLHVVTTPTFLTGELGRRIAAMYEDVKQTKYGGNAALRLNYDGTQVTGSNFFDAVIVDTMVKPFGVRTAMPADLGNADIMTSAKDRHYIDSRALVLRSTEDSYDARNNGIARDLAGHLDLKKGPAMLSGFTIEPWAKDTKGYGLRVVPSDDFAVIYDDRLAPEWNKHKFDTVDANGLPMHLDKKKGSRTWYVKQGGLSRLGLYGNLGRYLGANSGWDSLDDSSSGGRVALVGGEAAVANFSTQLRSRIDQVKSELQTRYTAALSLVDEAAGKADELLRRKD